MKPKDLGEVKLWKGQESGEGSQQIHKAAIKAGVKNSKQRCTPTPREKRNEPLQFR